MTVHGLLLAAGAGRRMGRPKALVVEAGRSWLVSSIDVLRDGGCDDVTVVLGAEADAAAALLPDDVEVVVADDWASGMAASLRAGLHALAQAATDAALVHLVDLPDVTAEVVRRVLAQGGAGPATLVRASYDGRPGHPVLLGRDHWAALLVELAGDRGARDYLASHDAGLVECGDLATGADVDRPPASTPEPTGGQRRSP